MKRFLGYYSPKLPKYLVYMLQQVEYSPKKFMEWLFRFPSLQKVMHRQQLVHTRKATLLVWFGYLISIWWLAVVFLLGGLNPVSLLGIILLPDVVIISYIFVVAVAWVLIESPRRKRTVSKAKVIFAQSNATKIAILGSYGKTSMKELLHTVLSEAKNVASTPGNKNIDVSYARWAATLTGKEDILLIEYGEAQPGDIAHLAELSKPDVAVITGLAPNHLDKYKSLERVKIDLLSISDFTDDIYCNSNISTEENNPRNFKVFNENNLSDLKVVSVEQDINGMHFVINISDKEVRFKTSLVGKHLIGPLLVCIDIALKSGLSIKQIQSAIAKTMPYEHRLQPRKLAGDSWIIDDTYNGSIEGFRAGLALLKDLKAKQKIYVTPGLVDQGEETENVHKEIGKLIVDAKPDKVVLMKNSVTDYILSELDDNKFTGMVEVRDDPLDFYVNIEQTLAAGDVALLQNDWTDNYS